MSEHSGSSDVSVPELAATGERFVTKDIASHIQVAYEHLHRYLFALDLCRGKDALDIASGEGYGSNLLAQVANRVTGVDISAEAVRFASGKYKRENLRFIKGDCLKIPLANKSVDVVVSFETIEHIAQHERFLQEIRRVLRADGVLVISSPDKHEYTDRSGRTNPFHVCELYRADFLKLVKRHFKNCVSFQQRLVAGSYLAADSAEGSQVIYGTHRGSLQSGTFNQGVNEGVYALAVCSNVEIPTVSAGIFENRFESERMWDWYEQGERIRDEMASLRRLTDDQAKQIERLQSLRHILEAPQASRTPAVPDPVAEELKERDLAETNGQAKEAPKSSATQSGSMQAASTATRSAEVKRLEELAKQMEAWELAREKLKEEVRSRDETISAILEEKEKVVRALNDQLRHNQDLVVQKDAALAAARTELQAGISRENADKLNSEVAALRSEIQSLEKEVIARGEWALSLKAEIAELRERLTVSEATEVSLREGFKSANEQLQIALERARRAEEEAASKDGDEAKKADHNSKQDELLESTRRQLAAAESEQTRLHELIQSLIGRKFSSDTSGWPTEAVTNDAMLRKEISSLQSQLEEARAAARQGEVALAQNQEILSSAASLTRSHEELKNDRDQLQVRVQDLESGTQELQQEFKTLAEQLSDSNARNVSLERTLVSLRSELDQMHGHLNDERGKATDAASQIASLNQHIIELTSAVSDERNFRQKEISQLNGQLSEREVDFKHLTELIEEERNAKAKELSHLTATLSEKEGELGRLTETLDSLSARFAALEKIYAEASEELRSEKTAREVEAVEHRLSLEKQHVLVESWKARHGESEKQIVAAQNVLNELMSQSEQTLRWGASLDSEVKQLRQVLAARDEEKGQLQNQLSATATTLVEKNERLAELESRLAEVLQELEKERSQWALLERELRTALEETRARESELAKEDAAKRHQLLSNDEQLFAAQATLNKVLAEAEATVQQVNSLESELALLRNRIKDLDTACENRDHWIQELEARQAALLADGEHETSALRGGIAERDRRLAECLAQVERLADKVRRMQISVSWRVTSPLRMMRRTFID